ncbi:hypothetical protein C1J03_12960 [Sulfitobacter sp. SK012]|uniref:hypothetical protein n=1 Tax=Sulfitobacter sp. SK012 TaxID=1389005 RepID=UPI000E0AA129|nr:hypothetical protein [Sulfitobacter sp. SK012]AXI46852.1 hypothetical protein C1J03_12960 [Sulfitobacter sp. SK012]
MRSATFGLALGLGFGLGHTLPAVAQTAIPVGAAPLSVIDWLDAPTPLIQQIGPEKQAAFPPMNEPPVTNSGTAPQVTTSALDGARPRDVGLVPSSVTGLPADIWSGSDARSLKRQITRLPDMRLPAGNALLYTVLLAEAGPPRDGNTDQDTLTLARIEKLMMLGALDPAQSLIEQAGTTVSPAHFDLWMRISLLNGTEDAACGALSRAPYLSSDIGVQIFCAARGGDWNTASLTLGSAKALGLGSAEKLELLDRFLSPGLFEDAAPMQNPRKIDPLTFRLFESIGEPLPTGPLPRAYAVADLRDIAGWKSQLEAAERLTRAGALPDNRLLGLYSDRKPAASGGIWDRVSALQKFEKALQARDDAAVQRTLPVVWQAMQSAELEVAFATLFSGALQNRKLTGAAADIRFEAGLLSPEYEATAAKPPAFPTDRTRTDMLVAVAQGDVPKRRPSETLAAAVFDAFATPTPDEALLRNARQGRLGASILQVLAQLNEGAGGNADTLTHALSNLRALGLEDTARRAALQVVLLERSQ